VDAAAVAARGDGRAVPGIGRIAIRLAPGDRQQSLDHLAVFPHRVGGGDPEPRRARAVEELERVAHEAEAGHEEGEAFAHAEPPDEFVFSDPMHTQAGTFDEQPLHTGSEPVAAVEDRFDFDLPVRTEDTPPDDGATKLHEPLPDFTREHDLHAVESTTDHHEEALQAEPLREFEPEHTLVAPPDELKLSGSSTVQIDGRELKDFSQTTTAACVAGDSNSSTTRFGRVSSAAFCFSNDWRTTCVRESGSYVRLPLSVAAKTACRP